MTVVERSYGVALFLAMSVIMAAGAWGNSTGPPADVVRLCGSLSGCDNCHSFPAASNATITFSLASDPGNPLPASG